MPNLLGFTKLGFSKRMQLVFGLGITLTNDTIRHPAIKNLLNSADAQFDVVIMEVFLNEAMLGIAHHLNAPVIGYGTFGATLWTCQMVGSPSPSSYVPHPMSGLTDKMNFLQRLQNTFSTAVEYIYMHLVYLPAQEKIYNDLFPNAEKTLGQLISNVSMVLLNNHFSLNFPRPYVPNMIEVGGIHLKRKVNELPTNIKSVLDNATNGAIYFSMGSNLKSTDLPVATRDAILRVFAKLNHQVLWKFEDTNLPGKPDNVFISDWFPQDDVLAHKNIKLFITHGGLLGTQEAVYHGVPVLGIPIFGDQMMNMAIAVSNGFGLTVQYTNLTEASLTWGLNAMLSNDK